ncbi:MAG: hypothetical protein ACYDDF_01630 [Thermoplasmatota archaeon]
MTPGASALPGASCHGVGPCYMGYRASADADCTWTKMEYAKPQWCGVFVETATGNGGFAYDYCLASMGAPS